MLNPQQQNQAHFLETLARQYPSRIAKATHGKSYNYAALLAQPSYVRQVQDEFTRTQLRRGLKHGAELVVIPGYRLPYAANPADRDPQFCLECAQLVRMPWRSTQDIRRQAWRLRLGKAQRVPFVLGAAPNLVPRESVCRRPISEVCELYVADELVALRVWPTEARDGGLVYVGAGEYEVVRDHVIVDDDPHDIREEFYDYVILDAKYWQTCRSTEPLPAAHLRTDLAQGC